MATFISHNPAETEAFASRLAASLRAGRILGLVGDLGAGKTQFVKGLARGLGVTEPVLSPTFALVHVHLSGRLPLFHLDFYRLENDAQIVGAGLAEYLTPAGVSVIEWWDRWNGAPPPALLRVTLETLDSSRRRIICDNSCS